MICLPSTQTLQLVLGAAATTNQLQYTVTYGVKSTGAVARNNGTSNSTTDVDMVAAPSSGDFHLVKQITVYNADTVAATVTIKLDQSGTETIIWKGQVGVGATLFYSPEAGFQILNQGNTGASFYATQKSGQSIGATNTPVQFPDVHFDTNSWYSNSTYKFTPQKAGKYRFSAGITVVNNSDQMLTMMFISKNNSTAEGSCAQARNYASGTNYSHANASVVFSLNGTTDYVYVLAYLGESKNLHSDGAYNWFCGEWVGD